MGNIVYKDCSKAQRRIKKNKLLKKIVSHFNLLPRKPIMCDGPGFKICARPPYTSRIARALYLTGIWEKEMTAMAQDNIQAGWNILDVGADIGYYTMLFALKCGPQGAVASFEPDPEPWPILLDNINMAKSSNITPYNIALSDHSGHGMMRKGGRGQMFPDREGEGNDTSTVELIPFDELWPKLKWKHLDLVKIDTEGAEMSILKGMEKTIKEYHPHLLIEVHPKQLKEVFNSSAEEVMNLITKTYQYKLTPVDRETLDIPSKGNITVWADWIGG